MNRVERISAILIQLQSKRIVRGQELADRFSISLRTAYRDIKALEEAGVPIVGEAGSGYTLMEGYKLPPIMFTKEEAIAFLTAEKLVEKLTDYSTFRVYQNALFKVKAVLKLEEKEHINTMGNHIEVLECNRNKVGKNDCIQTVLYSLTHKNSITINYLASYNQKNSVRAIEPVGIFLRANQWYLIAYCLLRNDYRTFRVDRIQDCKVNHISFRKNHPDLRSFLTRLAREKRELSTVILRTKADKLKGIDEQKFYYGFVSEKVIKDFTEMTFLTSSIESFARWYMTFGDLAMIVKPESLRVRVKELTYELIKNLK